MWLGYGRCLTTVTPCSVTSVTQRLSWTRELRPSLLRMLVTWVSTVRSDKNSLAAIWLLLRSSATSRAMSSCLRVRTARGSGLTAGADRLGAPYQRRLRRARPAEKGAKPTLATTVPQPRSPLARSGQRSSE